MKMSRDTDTPGREFFVAVAGPLVTLAIVLVGTAAGVAIAGRTTSTRPPSSGAAPVRRRAAARLLPGVDERVPAGVQPRAGVPARRRPDRPRGDLEGHRRPRPGDARVGHDRPGLRGPADGLGLFLASTGNAIDGLWLAVLGYLLWQSARGAVLQSAVTSRLDGVTVADIMDADPVTIPADMPVQQRLRGVLPALPGLAVVRGRRGRRHASPASRTARRSSRPPARAPSCRSASSPPTPPRCATTRRWRRCWAPSRCAGSAR